MKQFSYANEEPLILFDSALNVRPMWAWKRMSGVQVKLSKIGFLLCYAPVVRSKSTNTVCHLGFSERCFCDA